jgi:hypothetical protein
VLKKWKRIVGSEGYTLKSVNKHGYVGNNLNPASISTILKTLQEGLKSGTNEPPLSGHSLRVGAALDLLDQGEPLERIMLRGAGRRIRPPCHILEIGPYEMEARRATTVSPYN